MRLIDPPNPFGPIETWREFLTEMEALQPQDDPIVQWAIKHAREVIAEMERAPEDARQ
jgi:hypothetical protein